MPVGHGREFTLSLNWLIMVEMARKCPTEEIATFGFWLIFSNRTVKVTRRAVKWLLGAQYILYGGSIWRREWLLGAIVTWPGVPQAEVWSARAVWMCH
jgi:hypothetical protein